MVLVVILGRTGRTEFNFPATAAALVVNVGAQPAAGAAARDRRRRPGPGRLLPGRARADVRLHPAALPGPLRVGPAGAGRPRLRGPGRPRRAADADRRASSACSAAPSLWPPIPLALFASGFFTPEERALARRPAPPRASSPRRLQRPARRARPRRRRDPRDLRGRARTRTTLWSRVRCRYRLNYGSAVADALAAAGAAAPGGRGPSRRRRVGRGGRARRAARSGVGPGGEQRAPPAPPARRGACACRGRGCGGIRRSAAGPRRGRWRAGRGGRPRRRGRRACASRRRRGAWRSRTRRSRRRSRGRGSRPAAAASRRTSIALDCAQSTRRVSLPLLCTVSRRCRKRAPASGRADPGEAPGAGDRACRRSRAAAAPPRRPRVGLERRDQRRDARPAAARSPRSAAGSSGPAPRAAGSSRSPPCRSAARSSISRISPPSARTASAEPSSEALSRTRTSRSTPAGWVRSIASRQASRYSRPFVFTTQ